MNEEKDNFTNPLPQKVDYDIRDHLIYGNQKKWKKLIEWIVTIIAWIVILSYVTYLIYGSLAIKYNWYLPEFRIYNREMVLEIQKYFFILFIVMLIAIVLLIFWKNYNKRKYGRLHRRKFRPPVTNEELKELFQVDEEMIEKMQKERVVVLNTNIVPQSLGMGKEKRKEKKNDRDNK